MTDLCERAAARDECVYVREQRIRVTNEEWTRRWRSTMRVIITMVIIITVVIPSG